VDDFNTYIGDRQARWRLQHIADQRHGEQNGYTRPWVPPAERAETVSRILRDAGEAGLIKQEETGSGSKKYTRYVPFWA